MDLPVRQGNFVSNKRWSTADSQPTESTNDQSMKVFLHSLRVAAPHFKGFGDLIEGDDTQGVSEEAWDAIKDAVKAEAKIFTQGAQ